MNHKRTKRQLDFEWRFLEDDQPFHAEEVLAPGEARLVAQIGLLLLAGLLLVWQAGALEQRLLRGRIAAALAGAAGQEGVVHVVAQRGNLVVAEVLVADRERGAPAHIESRFLLRRDAGWQPVTPDLVSWGDPRERRTEHFRFLYRALDAEAVEALAAEIEGLYQEMLRDLGLEDLPGQHFVVEVVPKSEPPLNTADRHWLTLASPFLQRRPAGWSARDVLAGRLAHRLSSQLLAERVPRPFLASSDLRFMAECLRRVAADRWAPPNPAWEETRDHFVATALAEGRWLDLERFDYFLFNVRDFQQRSLQCSTVAEFIVARHGLEGVGSVLAAMTTQLSWRSALEDSLGQPYDQFVQQWRSWIEAWPA